MERAYNDFWWDRGTKVTSLRTSLVVDPPDGKVPALTAEAQKRAADEPKRPAFRGAGASGRGADTWLDRSTFERCITRGMPGAMSPTAYNNNYRITQGPGFVAIQIEMLGGARVIPTDGRPHVASRSASGWATRWRDGTATRWWSRRASSPTRCCTAARPRTCTWSSASPASAPGEIDYRVTITDPTTFTKPWTLAIPYVHTGEDLFEYACHEGNYGMEGILSGAREEERAAAGARR